MAFVLINGKERKGKLQKRPVQRVKKTAQEALIKMLMPLLLRIFPAVFIMIRGPIFIQMIANTYRP